MAEIMKGIPLPLPSKQTREYPEKYPFSKLEVGECFDIPKNQSTSSSLVQAAQRRLGRLFTTRKIDENNTRVWRIE